MEGQGRSVSVHPPSSSHPVVCQCCYKTRGDLLISRCASETTRIHTAEDEEGEEKRGKVLKNDAQLSFTVKKHAVLIWWLLHLFNR